MNNGKELESGLAGKTDSLELAKALERCSLVNALNQKLAEAAKMKEKIFSFDRENRFSMENIRRVLYSEEVSMPVALKPIDSVPIAGSLTCLKISYVLRANQEDAGEPADFFLDLNLSGKPKDENSIEQNLSLTFRIAHTKGSLSGNVGLLTQTKGNEIIRGDDCQVTFAKKEDFDQVMEACYFWIKKLNESFDQDKQLATYINAPITSFD
jgi:hypothetical protein